jgi:hypothetical protein
VAPAGDGEGNLWAATFSGGYGDSQVGAKAKDAAVEQRVCSEQSAIASEPFWLCQARERGNPVSQSS